MRECQSIRVTQDTLCEIEETGRQDGRAQEAQEDGPTDQVVTEVLLPLLSAVLAEVGKHLTQLTVTRERA